MTERNIGIAGILSATTSMNWSRVFKDTMVGLTGDAIGSVEYYTSFDEWGAEQMAKFWDTDAQALTIQDKFFKKLANKLKEVFEFLFNTEGRTKESFLPSIAFQEYLESLRQQGQEGNPLSRAAIEASQMQEQIDGVESPEGIGGDPKQDASWHINNVLEKLKIPQDKRSKIREILDHHNIMVKYGWTILQVAMKNRNFLKLQTYVDLVDQWYNMRMLWLGRAAQRTREMRALGSKQLTAFETFVVQLDDMVYLSKQERDNNVVRHPTDEEFIAIATKVGLTENGLALYTNMRKDFNDFLQEIKKIEIESLERELRGNAVAEEIIAIEVAEIDKGIEAQLNRPYFPHIRFGDFAVVVKKVKVDKNGKTISGERGETMFMEQFETVKGARKAGLAIQKRAEAVFGPLEPDERYSVGVDKIPETTQPFRGMPIVMLKSLKRKLNLSEEQKTWLDAYIVEQGPSRSFRKRLLKRKEIPGFSEDVMRSYANYFMHGSGYLARRRFGEPLQETINEMGEEALQLRNDLGISDDKTAISDVTNRRNIIEFTQDHLNNIMDPKPDWSAARALAFTWWIGAVPSSAVLNLTQIPLVAMPYLGARFGDIKTIKALGGAMKNIRSLYLDPESVNKLSDVFIRGLDLAMKSGFIDESFAQEVGATSEAGTMSSILPGNATTRALMAASHMSSWMFARAEQLNRRVVFRAAWDLAMADSKAEFIAELKSTEQEQYQRLREENFSDQEAGAWLAARDAVRRSQYEYAKWARPRFMRGKIASTLFTFFMFPQNTVWFMLHSPGNVRFMMMMLFMGGLQGLPFAEDISAMIRLFARKVFGVDFDLEREAREFVIELVDNPRVADMVMHGISREGFGMNMIADMTGLPIPSFDMSANIGMGQIIPGLADFGPPGLDFNESFSRISTDVAGASFGIGINLLKLAADSDNWDDAKTWERAAPRAIKNVMRAARFYDEGRERTSNDATVVEFDSNNAQHVGDMLGQAAGFTPARLSRKWDRLSMEREVNSFWDSKKSVLLQKFDHALEIKEPKAIAEVRSRIRKYNQEAPLGKRISGKTLRRSRKARVRARRRFEAGLPPNKSGNAIARDIADLFPLEGEDTSKFK